MLILADGDDVRDLVPEGDGRIRLIHLGDSRKVGEKRNFGCSRAAGEVVCHWDDDDWSGPERLRRQIDLLMTSGRSMVGFHTMRFTDGRRWWRYEGARNYALGTSLCYWKRWWEQQPFAAAQVGEDNQMVAATHGAGELATEDAGELMYATIHPGNTSPRQLGDNWKPIEIPVGLVGME